MARDFQSQLESISAKLLVVSERYRALEEVHRAAKDEITQLKAELLVKQKEIDELNVKAEYLSVASALRGDSAGQLEDAKAVIADLIQEIDRSIADLIE